MSDGNLFASVNAAADRFFFFLCVFRPGLLAMVPSLVASHIVAPHWQQPRTTGGSLSDPAGFDPSRSSAALWENKFEVHPDTPRDDPVYRLLDMTQRPVTPR